MVHMSHTYLTKKQMPYHFWIHFVCHSAQMINHIPAKYKDTLAPPFMLVHDTQANCCNWFALFSICCFQHDTNGSTTRSKNNTQTLDIVIIRHCPGSNAALM